MKKIGNMNYEELNQAFNSFSKKHSIEDDFDLNYNVINAIKPLLTDNEALINALYNLFRYGFMAGYMQNEADRKAHFHDETHRALTELCFNLPFGPYAEYFYSLMCGKIDRPILEYIKSKPVREQALAEHDRMRKTLNELTKGDNGNE